MSFNVYNLRFLCHVYYSRNGRESVKLVEMCLVFSLSGSAMNYSK